MLGGRNRKERREGEEEKKDKETYFNRVSGRDRKKQR